MVKLVLALWYYVVLRRVRIVPLTLTVLLGIAMNLTMKETPFWFPMLGTSSDNPGKSIFYWICINSIILYVAFDCLWTIWGDMFSNMRLRGLSLAKAYGVTFLLNAVISVTLVTGLVLISLLIAVSVGDFSFTKMDLFNLLPTLLLWVMGTMFSFWMTLLLSIVAKNAYLGFIGVSFLVIVSGLTFPRCLWLPGTQWIYGTHLIHGGPSFLESGVYLLALIIGEFLIGYRIIKPTVRR